MDLHFYRWGAGQSHPGDAITVYYTPIPPNLDVFIHFWVFVLTVEMACGRPIFCKPGVLGDSYSYVFRTWMFKYFPYV